ncbi:MAG: caspase family protein [Bacteroidota bacterium]
MPKQPKLPFAKSHAFLIGIDDYLHITPLSTAIKDAEDIANLLGDPTKHAYETHLLKNPSREEMEVFFAETKEIVQPEDRVLIYFAGHGIALDSEGDPEGFLVPVDAKSGVRESLFPMTRLHELLESLPCKHGLLILDCCFAGAFKWSTGFRDMVMDFGQVMYEERFWRFVEHPAWQVITSTSHDQKAADVLDMNALGLRETPTTDTRNSPFAWALKKVIDKDSQVDLHAQKQNKGVITATQLYLHVRDIVEGASHFKGKKQSPAIFSLSRHDSKGEFVFLKPGHPLNLKKAPNLNPYKGLGAYDGSEKDIGIFFGRSQAIQELSRRVAQQTLVVVSAPSGQGKSSVIRAGLLPFLKQDGFTDQIEIRPDDKDHSHWEEITRIQPDQKGVLYLDQFEELFALPDADRAKLEGLLIDLWQRFAQTEEPKARIILSIRSDFEWQLQASEFGSRFWQEEARTDFLYRLAPMSLEELREAVIRPAWSMAYEFESEEMVDQILEEINHAPGALPLLSFTLHQLYEKRDRKKRQLTLTAYRDELGRVNGALSKHADRIYESLPDDDHRDFMKKLVLRMVMLNDGSYSRRKVYRQTSSTLKKGGFIDEFDYPDHLDPVKDAVLDILEDALLIRSGKDDLGKYVEPMHDSLLNYWPRCLEWIKEFGHEHLVLQRQIWQAVVEHHQWVKPDTLLADGSVPQRPLWDSNPKLQQVQISVMDPQDRWLCYNPEPGFSVASTASMLWHTAYPEGNPLPASWSEAFQSEEAGPRYEEVRDQMNHWLNEDELEFVKESFERQADRLEQMRKQRDEAIRDKKIAEQKTRESEVSAMAIKAQQQEPINPVVALNLAIRAHQAYPTSETINTLALIDSNADNQYYFAQQKVDIEGIEVFAQFIPGTRKVLCQYNWHFRIWDLDDPAAEPEKVRSLHRGLKIGSRLE